MWHKLYSNCKTCGTTNGKHWAKGLCKNCYAKQHKPIKWSRNFTQCIKCGSTNTRHVAHGLCSNCYTTQPGEGELCACGCGLPVSTHKNKIRQFRKGHWLRVQGPTSDFQKAHTERFTGANNPCYGLFGEDHPAFGHSTTDETREIRRKHGIALAKKKWSEKRTNIEIILSNMLDEINVNHTPQYEINGKFLVDEYLPSYKVIVEAYGNFWHANPRFYNQENTTEFQKRNIRRDEIRTKYLEKCGYIVIVFWEYELKNNLHHCKDVLLNLLGNYRSL